MLNITIAFLSKAFTVAKLVIYNVISKIQGVFACVFLLSVELSLYMPVKIMTETVND